MERLGWVALVTATSTVVGFSYAAHAAVAPLMARDFGLDDVQVGLIATALYLASAVTMVVAGDFTDRYSPKAVNAWALALVIAGNAGVAVAPSYATLLVARFVGGVGAGLGLLGGLAYVARRYGDARPHFGQGMYGGGFPLGSAIALWSTPALAARWDWRVAFLILTAVMVAVALLWLRVRPVPRRARGGGMRKAVWCGNCWWTALPHATGFCLALAAGTWITIYILREFALPLETSGLLGSLRLVGAVLARPLGGIVLSRRHLSALAVMRGAQVANLAGLALLIAPGRPLPVALAGAVAVGFGGGVSYAAVFNTAAASLRRAPGAAQGITALGGLVSALAAAPAMGFAIQTSGFGAAWTLLAAISVVALACSFLMRGEEGLAPD
ncbi:hypothetical protein BH18CHL2_BH18CHL2_01050 [soil metagenome]